MPDMLKLGHLIKLLSAESEQVRKMVRAELECHLDDLQTLLVTHGSTIPPETMFHIDELLSKKRQAHTRTSWLDWLSLESEIDRLEAGLSYLSEIQLDRRIFPPMGELLNRLIDRFLESGGDSNVPALNHYLFVEKRIQGAREDFYHPLNSNLAHVLLEGMGSPISLVCIFMLAGSRLGLQIRGFNLPGHFLGQSNIEGSLVLFDCFNGGKHLYGRDIAALPHYASAHYQRLILEPPTAVEIITRVLFNLINAYHRVGLKREYQTARTLLGDLKKATVGNEPQNAEEKTVISQTRFAPGQLVKHKRHAYRGVVVDGDPNCYADESWYRSNQTQPDRAQPWYHILVHNSNVTTYAAQSNLIADASEDAINHPLLEVYFESFQAGHYTRNDIPWTNL